MRQLVSRPSRAAALAAPFAIACALASGDASALGPVDVEAAAIVGGGTTPSHFGTNPLGFGLGARAGVSIFGLYGGLSIVDYLGSSETTSVLQAESVTTKVHALLYGVDLGYGAKIGILRLRGQVGLGNFELTGSGEASGVVSVSPNSNSRSYLYVQPGVLAEVKLGILLLGASANVLMLPSGPNPTGNSPSTSGSLDTAFTFNAQAGVCF